MSSGKGREVPVGTVRETPQGYYKQKMPDGTWKLKHRVIMEEHLGRPLKPYERVYFVEGSDRQNPTIEDLELKTKAPNAQTEEYVLPAEKKCSGPLCSGKVKPIGAFYIQKNGRPKSYCKACTWSYWKKKHQKKRYLDRPPGPWEEELIYEGR